MKKDHRYLRLFLDFVKISSVTLGGGAVMLPIMEETFVKKRQWLTEEEMLEVFSVVQTLPGIIATNAAILIGKKVAGIKGSACAVTGVIVPSTLIMMLFAGFISLIRDFPPVEAAFAGVRAGSAALILIVLIHIGKKTFRHLRDIFIAVGSFVLLRIVGVNAVLIVLIAALTGFLCSLIPKRKEGHDDPG